MKNYKVDFDMKYSHEVVVKAYNQVDAKKRALAKFLKQLKQSDFNIEVESE